eukprot:scaffold490_cov186-Amphora_coffeaeformis.AAC.1
MTVIDWLKYTGDPKGEKFHVPCLNTKEDAQENMKDIKPGEVDYVNLAFKGICASALCTILGYGQTFWMNVSRHARNGTVPSHGLAGRLGNNALNTQVQMNLHLYFANIESLAEPTPMRFIREKTGTLTERDKKDLKLLPPYFTKRGMYRQYYYELGWNVSTDCKGSPNKQKKRTDDQWALLQQKEESIVSWRTFLNFWAVHYAPVVIGNPSADICGMCYKYCKELKIDRENKKEVTDDSDKEDEVEETENQAADPIDGEANSGLADDSGLITVTLEVQQQEKLLTEAAQHVYAARVMREYANNKMNESKSTKNDCPWRESKDVLVADYCQNLALPHTGMTQPGETYYYSPLSVYCFGTADGGAERPSMRAYVYDEGVAKKGGDNVSSLLYRDLKDRGWIDKEQGPREELTVIMDNCGGQNKNRMVLRMFGLLHEIGLYKKINICFLVAGHTKNICDRLFNMLKYKYRKSNCYSTEHMLQILNTAEDVTAVAALPTDFFEWDAYEERIYRRLKPGTVNRTQLFLYDSTKPGILRTQDFAGADSNFHEQDIRKFSTKEDRVTLVQNYQLALKTIKTPGLPHIKQWELYHKWRPFVPGAYQDILCPRPAKEVVDAMMQRNREKGQEAAAKGRAKKKQRTADILQIEEVQTQQVNDERTTLPPNRQNESSHHNGQDQMTLDSVTTRLNPETPR